MSQTYNRMQPRAFGKLQGTGVAMPRQYQAPQAYSPTQAPTQHNFQHSNTAQPSYGDTSSARPVKGLRFLSGIIDYFIVCVVFGGFVGVFQGFTLETLNGPALIKLYGTMAIVSFLYGLLMESHYQGTVGKLATGTVIVNKDGSPMSFGQAIGRNLGKFVSMIVPLYIPYLMVLWTKDNQSLHDKMAGTVVYRKDEIPQSYAETFA